MPLYEILFGVYLVHVPFILDFQFKTLRMQLVKGEMLNHSDHRPYFPSESARIYINLPLLKMLT